MLAQNHTELVQASMMCRNQETSSSLIPASVGDRWKFSVWDILWYSVLRSLTRHIKPEEWLQGQVELKIMQGWSYNKVILAVHSKFAFFQVKIPWLSQITGIKGREKRGWELIAFRILILFACFLLMGQQKGLHPAQCIIDYQDINWKEKSWSP